MEYDGINTLAGFVYCNQEGMDLSSFLSLVLLKMESIQAKNRPVVLGQAPRYKISREAKRDTLC